MIRSVAGLLFVVSACLACSPASPPNVILIVLDTTRTDHLSVYGYPRETSPYRQRFEDSGVSPRVRKRAGFSAIHWYLRGRHSPSAVLRARKDTVFPHSAD